MEQSSLPQPQEPSRKPWQEPAIVQERPLLVAAQGGPPREPWAQRSYLGPLNGSQPVGSCL